MKIAVLADIHGNMTALQAVLDYLEKEKVTHFIIAGDHISDCPRPKEVLKTISGLNGWFIKGNREAYVLETIDDTATDWYAHDQLASVIWTRDQLDAKCIDFIKNLSEQASISIEGCDKIRVVHGSPDNMYEHLYEHKADRNVEIMRQMEEQVLICAHTHVPWTTHVEGKLIVNPGALGVSFNEESAAEFAILKWEDKAWKAELKRIKYDISELERHFENSGLFEAAGIWPRLIVESLKSGANRNIDFIKRAVENASNQGYTEYKYIPNEVWKLTEEEWVPIDIYRTI